MTEEAQTSQANDQKISDKELNFRNLEAKYQRELAQERAARIEAERVAQEAMARKQIQEDEEDDSEPYVDKKKLEKKLAKFGEQTQRQTQSEIQKAVHTALHEERKNNWLKQNPDFYEVLQQHADKIVQKDPELAESILEMPEGFERQKLVYKNIKALGLHKPPEKVTSIQEKIDANRRSPYYQPSGIAAAPYAAAGDFSQSGQKNAYDKMKELQSRLRI